MTRPWLSPIAAALPQREMIAARIPVIETERLILRAPRLEDWDILEPIWRGPRAAYIGGPMNEEDAWLDFSQCVSSWVLRGTGYWTITDRCDGWVLGLTGLAMEPEDHEPEFGWLLTEEAEGHGYAYEACVAARDHLFARGIHGFVSYIDRANTRSVALAERLGARRDPGAAGYGDQDIVFRHGVLQ